MRGTETLMALALQIMLTPIFPLILKLLAFCPHKGKAKSCLLFLIWSNPWSVTSVVKILIFNDNVLCIYISIFNLDF